MRTQQHLSRRVLRSVASLLGQETVSFWLEQAGRIESPNRCLAEVVSVVRETADAVSLWLRPNELFPGFQAGQHVNLSVTIDGIAHTRSYSFSGAPRADGLVRLTVKQTPAGLVSRHLVNNMAAGQIVELGDVFGDMTLSADEDLSSPLLFCAAGSGITPLMSLLQSLQSQGWPRAVTLVTWARNADDVIFDADLLAMSKASGGRLRYVRALEQGADASRGDLQGRPDAQQFDALRGQQDLAASALYACGPDGFIQALRSLAGEQVQAFHAESFTPVALSVSADTEVKTFPIFLARSNRTVEVPNNKPLLKALQEQGINPPHGCGMGICNTCSCEKLVGTTVNLQNQSVCGAGKTALRLCVNAAQGPLTLAL